MNAHQLDAEGVIINTIVVDALDVFPDLVDVTIGGTIGDRIVNGVVVKSSVERTVPESVPKLKARLALIHAGYWSDVVAFFDSIPGTEGEVARAHLEDSQDWHRDNALVEAWRVARGMTTTQIDDLFIAADNIQL